VGAVHAVECGVAGDLVVAVGIVVDIVLTEGWDVVKTVDKIRGPVDQTVAFPYVPALRADLGELAAS
jgi:hypothetical protein